MTPLANAINGVLAIDPSSNAIEFEGSWYSWGDLSASKAAVLEALEGAGLGPQTRVGIMMRNRVELVGAILAVGVSDRCLVTINPTYPDARLADDLRNVRPPVVIGCAEDWQRPALLDAAREIGALCLEVSPAPGGAVRTLAAFDAERADESRRTAPGIALEMLTSGTTGTPKRIPFKATNFSQAVLGAAIFEKRRSEDSKPVLRKGVQILSAPFAHIGGLLGLFNVIVSGRCACLLERFKVDTFHDAIKRHRPKVAGSPPAALKMLLDANVPPEDLSSLAAFRTGTAPLDPDLADRFVGLAGEHAALAVGCAQGARVVRTPGLDRARSARPAGRSQKARARRRETAKEMKSHGARKAQMTDLFGPDAIQKLPDSHPIYRSFFEFEGCRRCRRSRRSCCICH